MIDIDFQQYISIIQSTLIGLLRLWKLWALLGAIALIRAILYLWERHQLAKSGIAEIDKMNGKTFEKYLQVKFESLGYQVIRTKYVGDYGADLVVEKDGAKTVIQAKRYKGNVGIKAVQEAVASKGFYDSDKAMVVTNSFFTKQAKELAKKNQVELWDRKEFSRQLLNIQKTASKSQKNSTSIETNNSKKVCVTCGKPVSDKVYQYCLDHPQLFKGEIYCFDHQKKS